MKEPRWFAPLTNLQKLSSRAGISPNQKKNTPRIGYVTGYGWVVSDSHSYMVDCDERESVDALWDAAREWCRKRNGFST